MASDEKALTRMSLISEAVLFFVNEISVTRVDKLDKSHTHSNMYNLFVTSITRKPQTEGHAVLIRTRVPRGQDAIINHLRATTEY